MPFINQMFFAVNDSDFSECWDNSSIVTVGNYAGHTWAQYLDFSLYDNYSTIAEAITAANSGTLVIIFNGTYAQSATSTLDISKSLVILGAGAEPTDVTISKAYTAGNQSVFQMFSGGKLLVANLRITTTSTWNCRHIRLTGTSSTTKVGFSKCVFNVAWAEGFGPTGTSVVSCGLARFTNCTFTRMSFMYTSLSVVYVTNCVISNNALPTTGTTGSFAEATYVSSATDGYGTAYGDGLFLAKDGSQFAFAVEALGVGDLSLLTIPVLLSLADAMALIDSARGIRCVSGELGDALSIAFQLRYVLSPRTCDTLVLAAPTTARVDLSALFSDTLTLFDPVRFAVHQLLAESINLADLTTEDIYRLALAAETLQVAEAVSPVLSVGAAAQDSLVARITPYMALGVAAYEAATLTDTSAASRRVADRLREALGVSEDILPTLTIAQTLLEALIAADIAAFVRQATASEVLALADELTTAIITQLTAPEALSILDEVSSSLVVLRTASEGLALDESGSISLTAQLLAGERLAFIGRLPLGEEVFSAWVLNTDTLGATSYTQFPMLALATHQGRTYGLTETGLYELTGETDDGAPIPAAIETGDLNFALHQDKNVPRAYLYLWAEGTMRLRTISSKRGCREEAWYEVTPMTGEDEQARIVRLARGVRGTTWQFRLENVDGCDFDLRGAEVLPVVLNKRGART